MRNVTYSLLRKSAHILLAWVLALPSLLFFSTPSLAANPSYAITDLGTLTGDMESEGTGVNSSGQIAGLSADAVGGCQYYATYCNYHAFLYSNGQMTNIGYLPNSTRSYGIELNDSGQVVGFGQTQSTLEQAFVYSNGVMTSLGALPGGSHSIAYGINNSGQIVGWSEAAGGLQRAFLYQNGLMTDIGTLPGDGQAQAYDINTQGQIVGWSYPATSQPNCPNLGSQPCPHHAFLDNNGIFTDLGTLPGDSISQAFGINDHSQIVGWSGNHEAFIYSNGQMNGLGTLTATGESAAIHINSSGQAVGWARAADNSQHAVVYTNNSISDLNSLIPANSGWILTYAFDINASGQITGSGFNNGVRHAYLLTPQNQPPVIGNITVSPNPVQVGTSTTASANFTDSNTSNTHTASWNWGDGNTTSGTVTESNGSGSVTDSHTYTAAGVYTVTLTLTSSSNLHATSQFQYIAVYNPTGGFLTGSGKFNSQTGWDNQNPTASGEVKFGVSAQYLTGSNIPTGQEKMTFNVGNLDFAATSFQWLVVSGSKATLQGNGTINGAGNYTFLLSGIDGSQNAGTSLVRIKITDPLGAAVYDTQPGAPDTADPTTALTQGNIKVHP